MIPKFAARRHRRPKMLRRTFSPSASHALRKHADHRGSDPCRPHREPAGQSLGRACSRLIGGACCLVRRPVAPFLLASRSCGARHHVSLLRRVAHRSISPSHVTLGGDLLGDVVRVAAHALDLFGGNGVEELETDEVEAGL